MGRLARGTIPLIAAAVWSVNIVSGAPALRRVRYDTLSLRSESAYSAPAYRSFPYQRGMNIWSWTPDGYEAPAMRDALTELASDGVDWVDLVPTWFQSTPTSSELKRRVGYTPSDTAVAHAVRTAHALGLKVAIKPQVNVADHAGRSTILPSDPARWWRSYDAFIKHYARLAASTAADELVVGTELSGVVGDTWHWERLIRSVRAVYHGYLTYAALPYDYRRVKFWPELDAIGVDAYWKLSSKPSTDFAALVGAWKPILSDLAATSARWSKPVVFTEAGYASQVGTVTDPASWTLSERPAPEEQAVAYLALLRATSGKAWFRGVNWWEWRQDNKSIATDFTPEKKAAEEVLRAAWDCKGRLVVGLCGTPSPSVYGHAAT